MADIAAVVPLEESQLKVALDELVADGRVVTSESGDVMTFRATECIIEMGEPGGWEAAVFDHYQAVVVALCTKLRRGRTRAEERDVIGGSTYGFTIWKGHPHHDEVLGFLARVRREAGELRGKVRAFNAANAAPPGETVGVIAYVGQTVLESESEVQS
jgi:hypothetical protein